MQAKKDGAEQDDRKMWINICDDILLAVTSSGNGMVTNIKTLACHQRALNLPTPLDHVTFDGHTLLAMYNECTMVSAMDVSEQKMIFSIDLKATSGRSLSHYGINITTIFTWKDSILLHINDKLLSYIPKSCSMFPVCKDLDRGVEFQIAGDILMLKGEDAVTVQNPSETQSRFQFEIQPSLLQLSSDGRYVAYVTPPRTLAIIRTSDGCQIASAWVPIKPVCMAISSDSRYVILAGRDRHLYNYLIVDPREAGHFEEIKELPSRNQPLLTEYKDIITDQRYKSLHKKTSTLESSPYPSESLSESSSDSEDGCIMEDSYVSSNTFVTVFDVSPEEYHIDIKSEEPVFHKLPNGERCLIDIQYEGPVLQTIAHSRRRLKYVHEDDRAMLETPVLDAPVVTGKSNPYLDSRQVTAKLRRTALGKRVQPRESSHDLIESRLCTVS